MIDQENVEKYAQDNDVPFSNYASLTRPPQVQALIQAEIDRVNKKFARVEQVKKFFLLDTQLSAEDEEAIRRPILEKYEHEGSPYYSTARIWDDGILDPVNTRQALALGLSAAFNAPVPAPKYGIFRM